MNGFPSRAEVESLHRQYPEGTRVVLIQMNDPYTKLQPGDQGTVIAVDDMSSIHSGLTLGAAYGVDVIRKL